MLRHLWCLALFVGCSNSGPLPTAENPAPDFALLDVNPTSASHDQAVTASEFSGRVSAWYFGSAT